MSGKRNKTNTGDGYLALSSRPWVSLVFILPLVLIYEGGILFLGENDRLLNGADLLLRQWLRMLGFGQYFLLPLVMGGILLAWHHTTREKWKFSPATLPIMLLECTIWGFVLLLLAQAHSSLFSRLVAAMPGSLFDTDHLAHLVAFCGAGVYEELLFRLILLSAVAWLFRWGGGEPRASKITAVVVTSLLFSAAHYQLFTNLGDPVELGSFTFWNSFLFRIEAGLFFSVLFLKRGFGIAAGSHAIYDILTEIM